MAQLSVNTVFYDQLIKRIQKFLLKYSKNDIASYEQMAEEYNQLLTDVNKFSTMPISTYEQVIKGEPPSSKKFNRFISNVADDLNIIAKQLDYQSAQIVSLYNLFNSEVEKENQFTDRMKSKVRVLQAYSQSPGNDIYFFGDYFDNMDFIDLLKIPKENIPLVRDGVASLSTSESYRWNPSSIAIINDDSNGFIGNNHAVYMTNDVESNYRYIYQDNNSIGLIANIIDDNPMKYFEYEAIVVDKKQTQMSGAKEFEFLYTDESIVNGEKTTKYKPWIRHSADESLNLSLKIKSSRPGKANSVTIIPYFGASQNVYSELKIVRITAISRATNQLVELLNEPIYIGSTFVPQSIESSGKYYYNKANIFFPEINTDEFNVYIKQENYTETKIKHMYWQPTGGTGVLSRLESQSRFDPSSLVSLGFSDLQYDLDDIIPSILRPNTNKDSSSMVTKKIPVTFKITNQVDRAVISFSRTSLPTARYFFTNAFTDFQTPAIQQEKSYTTDTAIRWSYDSVEAAKIGLDFINKKISDGAWSVNNFQDLKIEPIKSDLKPKTIPASILLKKMFEYYNAKRASISLRSIEFNNNTFGEKAEIISKPFIFPYQIKNLSISADTSEMYTGASSSKSYIKYYVSLDDGNKWIKISPIENPFNGIPEILSLNENVQGIGQLRGIKYLNYPEIPEIVTSVRVKIELEKPRYENISPILYSYQISGRVEQS